MSNSNFKIQSFNDILQLQLIILVSYNIVRNMYIPYMINA